MMCEGQADSKKVTKIDQEDREWLDRRLRDYRELLKYLEDQLTKVAKPLGCSITAIA